MQTDPLVDFLVSNRIHSLKYLRSTTLGSKDIGKKQKIGQLVDKEVGTDSEDNMDKRNEDEIHAIGKKKVLIAKVRNTVVIQSRQGKWIPVSVRN